jgi:hypothetical protein
MVNIPLNYILSASVAAACALFAYNYLQTKQIIYPRAEVKRFAQQALGKRQDDDYPLEGLTVMVTGATSGLGKEVRPCAIGRMV